jgi:hypothetical protein
MVYIDDFFASFLGMKMSHMIDDMAEKIGIQRRWKHNGTHYDVCKSKRELAITFGAVEVSVRTLAKIEHEKRKTKARGKMNAV